MSGERRFWRRPTLRIRTLLVLVAALAFVFWLATEGERRAARYRTIASDHEARILGLHGVNSLQYTYLPMDRNNQPIENPRLAFDLWHRDLWVKYDHASRHPWAALTPDSPPPKAETITP